jgi:MFS family permease
MAATGRLPGDGSGGVSRPFLTGTQLQSELGTGAAYVALLLVAYERLHSGWAIALVLLADFLSGIVLAAPFGALADRLPRRRRPSARRRH